MPSTSGLNNKNQDIMGVIPYIRIHDYILSKADIEEFSIFVEEFLPTMYLKVRLPINTLSEANKLNDGDLISVGIRADLKTFKPISVDFIVTEVINGDNTNNDNNTIIYEYQIWGRLNIPLLESEKIRFSYIGYAEEALQEIASRVGLGYVQNANNPNCTSNSRTNSNNKEVWNCYSTPLEFIHMVTDHMWAGVDSFFNSWIDLYMNLVNINVGDILGRSIEDDGAIDTTKFRSIVDTAGTDGEWVHNDLHTADEYKDNKMFTNDQSVQTSVWFVNNYHLVNNSTAITKKYGMQKKHSVYIQNNGLGQSLNDSERSLEIGVWYNRDKISLGYVTMNGPAQEDKLFKKADNGSYIDQNYQRESPKIFPIESDGDTETRFNEKSNKNTSGNFSKKYFIAPEHNLLNLVELQKQYLIITTTGFNNGFARGEKVPCILYRQTNEKWLSEKRETRDNTFIFDAVCSGWFMVDSMRYTYKPSNNLDNTISDWKTEVKLTRREWFPPEATSTAAMAGDTKNVVDSATDAAKKPSGIVNGTTKPNDVTENATEASTPSDRISTSQSDAPRPEASEMEKEAENNMENLEKSEEAIAAVDALEKTEELAIQTEEKTIQTEERLNEPEIESVASWPNTLPYALLVGAYIKKPNTPQFDLLNRMSKKNCYYDRKNNIFYREDKTTILPPIETVLKMKLYS